MRDGLPLIGLELFKESLQYQITDVYVTSLNHTYLAVKNAHNQCTTNYRFTDIRSFLKENGFSIRESVGLDLFYIL
jgi:hypothetical protein